MPGSEPFPAAQPPGQWFPDLPSKLSEEHRWKVRSIPLIMGGWFFAIGFFLVELVVVLASLASWKLFPLWEYVLPSVVGGTFVGAGYAFLGSRMLRGGTRIGAESLIHEGAPKVDLAWQEIESVQMLARRPGHRYVPGISVQAVRVPGRRRRTVPTTDPACARAILTHPRLPRVPVEDEAWAFAGLTRPEGWLSQPSQTATRPQA